jgi:RNA polymerase sigma-70 factor (ECF subfamily)
MSVAPVPGKPVLRLVRTDDSGPHAAQAGVDDAELLASVLNGDTEAAETFFERLRPRIEMTVRRLLGAHDPDREDCVQNSFIGVIRALPRYRGECSLGHWASQIAARVVYKHIRHRKVHRRVFGEDADVAERGGGVDSQRRAVASNLVNRVRTKLSTLDPDRAYTFMLHDVLGFDLREIAQITDVSVGAAQKRLVRGRREVYAKLASDPELRDVAKTLGDEP